MIVRSGSNWIMPGSCNVWETAIIRVSGEYSPDQVYTTEEEGRARYWHSFTEGQFGITEEICRSVKSVLRDQSTW